MAMQYPPQSYYLYGQPQWPEDVKPALTEDDSSSVLDDKVLDSSTPADMTAPDSSDSRRPSLTKLEDDYSAPAHVWQERPHGVMPSTRHFSQSSIPLSSPNGQFFGQVNATNCGSAYLQNQSWPLSARSEASTPTPFFGPVQETFGQQVPYSGGPVNFSGYSQQDPVSAVSMSPQSSQGGWASTTSSDAAETGRALKHARYRPASPMLVLRSDGIRKKNAKFEIPKERNLANIDALIQQSTNEEEKKELKQQKRLLRNRQAALDSRQRKKTHTERLEQEKKLFASQKAEMEDTIAHLETTLAHEREQWVHQRQQYEQFIQQIRYDRDEAIRTKTLETAELRRMNNILKDAVRDLERQQNARAFSANTSDAFSNDFSTFRTLDLDDNWEDEFSLINSEDLKMEEPDSIQRQATPRPPTSSTQPSASVNAAKSLDVKVDAGFSWNTFYMCLLSGAFIVSQAGSKATTSVSSAAVVTPSMPALSEDYRAEAGNVLNAVLASGPESAHEILPSRPAASMDNPNFSGTLSGSDLSQAPGTSLDNLHTTLTTPSRQQEAAAAFSLSASSYNHITNADGIFDNDEDEVVEVKPTRLQQLFADMQAQRDGIEKMSGLGSKARERSVLLDRVPEKVLRDFREMIAQVE
ncbi:uncharacterized protein Z518_11031 [Rhinocladiella mackenziei CBS 650.93]|uniref:Rhinocladiella mackenziei CBS 650.93 unplaced genomic scaffold supercont1.11, whole genome shotgun sequence n=1 Tax=Rhinocladiella mackenziei CBS 650.93 TaxID=1442369 RepID=A0A0D2I1K5_9EURO|nr:uncharacterized protein Z518_11031 [Rhinocladiella mackenziei CBS 650.93]KIW99618.1 hypothetical protein Z518_11031 [Rhinocladiella mackenziei CBS 650.93]